MIVTKVGAKPKTIGTADINIAATLPQWCRLKDNLSILLEPCLVRRICSHFFFLLAFHLLTLAYDTNNINHACVIVLGYIG